MKIPVWMKVVALVFATTLFYTYVGQLVPQKEVHPPEDIEIASTLTSEEMVDVGIKIAQGKGLCFTCHTAEGKKGSLRFPDLKDVGSRAGSTIPGLSQVEYLTQSLYEPDSFIVAGFSPGMPVINEPPIGLSEDEILCLVAWLQSMGGELTVTMDTDLRGGPADGSDTAATADADAGSPGAILFAHFECAGCHSVGGNGDASLSSLDRVAARTGRSALIGQLLDPSAIDAPGHEGSEPIYTTAKVSDVQALVDYLISEGGGS